MRTRLFYTMDDVNTFDHVIDTLMRVCDHTLEQAKQCSIIVHYKGNVVLNLAHIQTSNQDVLNY